MHVREHARRKHFFFLLFFTSFFNFFFFISISRLVRVVVRLGRHLRVGVDEVLRQYLFLERGDDVLDVVTDDVCTQRQK